MTFWKYSQ